MGRPSLPAGEKKEPLSLRLPGQVYVEYTEICSAIGFTKTELGALAISALVSHFKANPEVLDRLREINDERTALIESSVVSFDTTI